MALDSSLVRVAVTGGVYVSLDGTGSVPSSAVAAIPVDFDELGYVTDEGVTQTINADTEDIQAWQNGDIVRKIQTSHDVTFGLTLLETNPKTLEAYYGNYDNGKIEVTGDQLPRLPWVIDVFDGDEKVRICIPDGQITERGDITYVSTGAITYPITITAYPVNGVKAHLYAATAASS